VPEITLNKQLANILKNHGIEISEDEEFIYANLPSAIKFKTNAAYTEINNVTSSQLDVIVITEDGKKIIESFGDFGTDLEAATERNLLNFNTSSLHTFLTAFGSCDEKIIDQVTIEEWKINDQVWTAYIGNLIPKASNKNSINVSPPTQFFEAIQTSIISQKLDGNLHWFRGYYAQFKDKITTTEFLMDNDDITASCPIFSSLPVMTGVEFYSCRNFIILKRLRKT